MNGTRRLGAAAFVVAVATLLAACPGTLDDPQRFGEGGAGGCNLDIDVVEDIFADEMTCANAAACHGGSSPAAGLDLASPDPASRLVGVMAGGSDVGGSCGGRVRVDPGDPDSSLLVEKLQESPSCGVRMPQLMDPLSSAEIACVREWVRETVGEVDAGTSPMDGGDGSDGGASDAGSDGDGGGT